MTTEEVRARLASLRSERAAVMSTLTRLSSLTTLSVSERSSWTEALDQVQNIDGEAATLREQLESREARARGMTPGPRGVTFEGGDGARGYGEHRTGFTALRHVDIDAALHSARTAGLWESREGTQHLVDAARSRIAEWSTFSDITPGMQERAERAVTGGETRTPPEWPNGSRSGEPRCTARRSAPC